MMTTEVSSTGIESLKITSQDKSKAEELKAKANKLFGEKHFQDASDYYTQAISHDPTNPAYFTNRALAYMKMEWYAAAVKDADEAIALDPSFVKAYYRRASGNMALGKLKEAANDFRSVIKLEPNDPLPRNRLAECEKEIKRLAFEKAISFEAEKVPILTRIGDIDNMIVEASYDGPHLDASGITIEFVKSMLQHMKDQKKLHRKYVYMIMRAAKEIFEAQPTLVDISIPSDAKLTVCGDIHGQFYDLLNVFEMNGIPSPTNMYLWNGDFVDRGSFSVECVLTLFAFKWLYPQSVYLSRGNHETDNMNKTYGFEGEVQHKYTDLTFQFFSEIFNAIPLGNLIGNKILVVHGGLFSRDDVTLDEIRQIDRFRQPGIEGLMCELLWSDPQLFPGRSASKRGVGIQFGPDVTHKFLELNGLDLLIRSHEVKEEGYQIDHDGKCVTIFSAPNYCDSVGNKGAYIHITPELKVSYHQFSAVPHPPVRAMQYARLPFGGM